MILRLRMNQFSRIMGAPLHNTLSQSSSELDVDIMVMIEGKQIHFIFPIDRRSKTKGITASINIKTFDYWSSELIKITSMHAVTNHSSRPSSGVQENGIS